MREQLLAFLCQHRAADTAQLHRMLYLRPRPRTDHMRRCLRQLQEQGLVEAAVRAHHPSVWALSDAGRALTSGWTHLSAQPPRRGSGLGSQRTVHTLTVTRTCLAFLDDARGRGDEFTPLDWRPEMAHPLRDGAAAGERMLIADALMRYTRTGQGRGLLRAFVEVDRATESPERLAAKAISYARFYHSRPAPRRGAQPSGMSWQQTYPRFPRVLFVLSNAGARAQAQRIADLQAMVRQHPLVASLAGEVPLGVGVLEDLEELGASAPVWTPLTGSGERRNWMDL